MVIVILFIIQWYAALFFQSIFHHRYSAHGLFTMSKGMERLFHIGCFVTQGSSYISANSYGIMHRMHHAETDTKDDPHSPSNTKNVFTMMMMTRNNYIDIYTGKTVVDEKFKKDLPEWQAFDKIVHTWYARVMWIAIYITVYALFATAWWQWLLLPATIMISPLQGMAVNWWAHRFGYVNFKMDNTSKNIMPIDFIFWGESFHNNHHKHPGNPNNAHRWFEFDMGYFAMKIMNKLKIIKLRKKPVIACSYNYRRNN